MMSRRACVWLIAAKSFQSLLSQVSPADREQHLRHGDVTDRVMIGAGEEPGRKHAAQRNSRLAINADPWDETLPPVQPEKPERHLQSAVFHQPIFRQGILPKCRLNAVTLLHRARQRIGCTLIWLDRRLFKRIGVMAKLTQIPDLRRGA
jgi:hypothetical protein